jgi:hypothetical protein
MKIKTLRTILRRSLRPWMRLSLFSVISILLGYCFFIVSVQSFTADLMLPEKTLGACTGVIVFAFTAAKAIFDESHTLRLRRSIGFLFLAAIALVASTAMKLILFEVWKDTGDFSSGFSSGFRGAPLSFIDVGGRPKAWLAYLLFLTLIVAFGFLSLGIWQLLAVFFPSDMLPRYDSEKAESGAQA